MLATGMGTGWRSAAQDRTALLRNVISVGASVLKGEKSAKQYVSRATTRGKEPAQKHGSSIVRHDGRVVLPRGTTEQASVLKGEKSVKQYVSRATTRGKE